jgi:3-isopropylmalate dehydratase small subunit
MLGLLFAIWQLWVSPIFNFNKSKSNQEFGGITGICVPDEITKSFIDKRKNPKHKKDSLYYQPDKDAQYAESYTIDLHKVESFVARYPSPDDVVRVSEVAGTKLDGCFIGACTTTHEDLVLAALVLEVGLKKGMRPTLQGKRKVVPGSRPILHDLTARGLIEIYKKAGFEIGVPGCSYCVGMSADKADKGEVWLSSQNRNFENRMGPGLLKFNCAVGLYWLGIGAIGSIASAVTVAASSFSMTITDPSSLLDHIDLIYFEKLLGTEMEETKEKLSSIQYVEPAAQEATTNPSETHIAQYQATELLEESPVSSLVNQVIIGRVQTLGDFIDTDALAPAEALTSAHTVEEFGEYCLYHTHPNFRRRVKVDGLNIVVAGKGFGVGSSRENAVTALQGTGVKCVIALSFAFIYARNQPNLGLLGVVIEDEYFYKLAQDGTDIEIDVQRRVIKVAGTEFGFHLSELEIQLWQQGGMSASFARWGKSVLSKITSGGNSITKEKDLETSQHSKQLDW